MLLKMHRHSQPGLVSRLGLHRQSVRKNKAAARRNHSSRGRPLCACVIPQFEIRDPGCDPHRLALFMPSEISWITY